MKSKPKQTPKIQATTRTFQPPSKPSSLTQALPLFCAKDYPIRQHTTHLGITSPPQLLYSTLTKMTGSVRLMNIYSLNIIALRPTLFLKSTQQHRQEENAKCQKISFSCKISNTSTLRGVQAQHRERTSSPNK